MGPEKKVRKIEIPTDTPTEFELGDTAADIEKRREKREQREREREKAEKKEREEREREKARRLDTPQSQMQEAVTQKRLRTERSEMNTEGGLKASTSTKYQSRCKKEHMEGLPVGKICKQQQAVSKSVQLGSDPKEPAMEN